jgi:choline kinase
MVEPNTREDTMKVKTEGGKVIAVSDDIPTDQANGNFIGMAKFSKSLAKILFNEISILVKEKNVGAQYPLAIEKMIEKGIKIGYSTTNNLPWFNVNDQNEFKKSKKIFKNFGVKN